MKISAKAAQTEGARIPVQVNDTLTVKDLYHALMIESANNSAVALAEHMAKSEKDFVQLMDAKAKQLKCRNMLNLQMLLDYKSQMEVKQNDGW